ncbi:Protein DDI1-like protein 2 [Armadillidium vulgare]|nr:Protein DDI1-like protein 2 [Armadillidium vulgare]
MPNMEAAMEFNPESFGTVHMLYINCFVNGHPVKAFIDSGAQTTIMSQSCAERCNIMRLVDTRWAGIAKGVGTQKIIGRVHMGQIQIEGDFLASSFSILEEQPMDMLLGLDMLKRHQMSIDLKENQLIIGTTNTKTRFLNESELPECARLTPPGAMTEEDILRQSERKARMEEDEALAKALADSARETSNKSLKNDVNSKPHRTDPDGDEGTSHSSNNNHSSSVAPPPSATTNAISSGGASVPEEDIKEIMQIGFSREEVIKALRDQNGNKTQAIAALFAKSIRM